MNYQDCLNEIEALQARGIHRGLDRMTSACQMLKNPQNNFPSVHIAGTNGKGSTGAITAEILKRARFRTGFTLSPHIENYRERIQINGEWISQPAVVELHTFLKKKVGHIPLTYFEWTILMAFLYFAQSRVDMAVLECGMGGRWDATNMANPLVGAITNISLDHEAILGSSLEAILTEKLQILKPGMTAWTGIEQKSLINQAQQYCRLIGVPLHVLSDYFRDHVGDDFSVFDFRGLSCGLKGAHQKKNGALAVAICQSLITKGYRIPRHAIEEGLAKLRWPARLEVLSNTPLVLIDGAHNRAGVEALALFLKDQGKMVHLVFGTLNDRPFVEMAKKLIPYAKTVSWALFDNPKAYSRQDLNVLTSNLAPKINFRVLDINREKWHDFIKGIPPEETILITGSLYLVSQIRGMMKGTT